MKCWNTSNVLVSRTTDSRTGCLLPSARLSVESVDLHDAGPGFGLAVTDTEGNVTRK
jgi:hypothetical protein